MNREFRHYGWYALGEIGLVIVGILIALQIDTWYEDRKAQASLTTYLEAIAADVQGDVQRVERLKRDRLALALETRAALFNLGTVDFLDQWYDGDTVRQVSPLISRSRAQFYFVANSGTYRALESSGLINELEDRALKGLLHDYYRAVDRITNTERDLNTLLGDLARAYEEQAPAGLPFFYLQEPQLLWDEDDSPSPWSAEARRSYGELLASRATQSLLSSAAHQPLFQEYEQLITLGRALVANLDARREGRVAPDTHVFTADGGRGFPLIFEQGLPALHSLGVFTAPSCPPEERCFGMEGDVVLSGDALVLDYRGGQPWAFFYAYVGPIDIHTERYATDFSAYDRIQLELRRDGACAGVEVVLKDVDDPDDGTERRVPLKPDTEWTTYTLGLDQFPDADPARLSVVTGFLFNQNACRLAVRSVRYLEPGQET